MHSLLSIFNLVRRSRNAQRFLVSNILGFLNNDNFSASFFLQPLDIFSSPADDPGHKWSLQHHLESAAAHKSTRGAAATTTTAAASLHAAAIIGDNGVNLLFRRLDCVGQ